MKNQLFSMLMLSCVGMLTAQEHFSGITTSKRTGILNGMTNPAEFANMESRMELQLFATSINVANNKIGFSDLTGSSDFEELIFRGDDPVNFRLDAEILGPGFAMKINKWTFALTTKAYAKLNMIDIDVNIGDAIANAGINSFVGSTTINADYNQRLNATTWGEVGFTAARDLFENETHKISGGITFKLLFPGSYANFGVNKFNGTIDYALTDAYLNNTNAEVNIAYSGNLANSFSDFSDYSRSLFGNLNGTALDLGVNYQMKKENGTTFINSGLAFRNLGKMKFRSDNNSSTNYLLEIPPGTILEPGLNLNQFENVDSLQEVETILLESGYLSTNQSNRDFRITLPATLAVYADVTILPTLHVTLFTQQKLVNDSKDNQVTTQNMVSLTPRFSIKSFEVFSPWASNEISGITGGLGFRAAGFFIGSGSIITAVIGDTKQADFYIGYRLGLGKN